MPNVSSLTPLLPTYAYVTYQDIKQVGNLKDQTVIVVKAPTETKLEVSDPDEVRDNILFGHVEWTGFILGGRDGRRQSSVTSDWATREGFLFFFFKQRCNVDEPYRGFRLLNCDEAKVRFRWRD